ncbi:hypothetical protein D3C87_173450 [compost metagenome]|jgi:hypothetical protein
MQFSYKDYDISVLVARIDGHLAGTFAISRKGKIVRQEDGLFVQGTENEAAHQTLTIAKAYVDRIEVGDLKS